MWSYHNLIRNKKIHKFKMDSQYDMSYKRRWQINFHKYPSPPPQTHTYMVLKFIVVSNGLISYIAPRTIGFYHTLIIKIIKFRQN